MRASPPSEIRRDSGFFTQTGGYRVGRNELLAINASWPFGTLEVHRGQLVLRCITRLLAFPVASISRLSVHEGFLSTGLRVEHTVPEYPKFVVFWSSNIEDLRRELTHAGFQLNPD